MKHLGSLPEQHCFIDGNSSIIGLIKNIKGCRFEDFKYKCQKL